MDEKAGLSFADSNMHEKWIFTGMDGKTGLNVAIKNKPKMVCFLIFKFLFAFKLTYNVVLFYKTYRNVVISKSEKSNQINVKFKVEYFEHLHCKIWGRKLR